MTKNIQRVDNEKTTRTSRQRGVNEVAKSIHRVDDEETPRIHRVDKE